MFRFPPVFFQPFLEKKKSPAEPELGFKLWADPLRSKSWFEWMAHIKPWASGGAGLRQGASLLLGAAVAIPSRPESPVEAAPYDELECHDVTSESPTPLPRHHRDLLPAGDPRVSDVRTWTRTP